MKLFIFLFSLLSLNVAAQSLTIDTCAVLRNNNIYDIIPLKSGSIRFREESKDVIILIEYIVASPKQKRENKIVYHTDTLKFCIVKYEETSYKTYYSLRSFEYNDTELYDLFIFKENPDLIILRDKNYTYIYHISGML